jgi:LysM repeat protein
MDCSMTLRSARSHWLRGTGAVAALAVVAGAGSSAFGVSGYTIRTGDTLSGLASRFGVTETALINANHVANPDRIYAGRTIVIPHTVGSRSNAGVSSVTSARPASSRGPAAPRTASVAAAAGADIPGPLTSLDPTDLTPDPVTPGPLAPVRTPGAGAVHYPADLLAHTTRLTLVPAFRHWASVSAVPAGLLEAVAWMESGWRPTVVSRTGAVGIGQIEPKTATFISTQLLGLTTTLDSRVAEKNIRMSAAYLAWLLQQTNGDVATAVGAYYQGLHHLRATGPLSSTRRYVAGVGALWELFRSG